MKFTIDLAPEQCAELKQALFYWRDEVRNGEGRVAAWNYESSKNKHLANSLINSMSKVLWPNKEGEPLRFEPLTEEKWRKDKYGDEEE